MLLAAPAIAPADRICLFVAAWALDPVSVGAHRHSIFGAPCCLVQSQQFRLVNIVDKEGLGAEFGKRDSREAREHGTS